MSEAKQFGAGIPTKADVKRLSDKFGVPTVGRLITYESISETIGEPIGTCRYKTVVAAWRRLLEREARVLLVAVPTMGLERATEEERVHVASQKHKSGLRMHYRASKIAENTDTDRLPDNLVRICDHLARIGAVMRLAAATESKRLKLPLVSQ